MPVFTSQKPDFLLETSVPLFHNRIYEAFLLKNRFIYHGSLVPVSPRANRTYYEVFSSLDGSLLKSTETDPSMLVLSDPIYVSLMLVKAAGIGDLKSSLAANGLNKTMSIFEYRNLTYLALLGARTAHMRTLKKGKYYINQEPLQILNLSNRTSFSLPIVDHEISNPL